ncbi:MarR family winged helix-turn-helix transcriptional regulator [Paenibacillus sp. FSL L8-0436]|uniref:MarR family winged helix-turn-helix transcriptional regulator n=1 Tax=Paenibacillus sp. FSL L8-0436 TaxID=2954686 RepID=UPI0031592E96
MNPQDSQEEKLLMVFENIKRLTTRTKWNDSIPHGEFLMMFAINVMMKKESREPEAPECPGVMISKLSELLQISRPTASQVVSSLEEKGYIERAMSVTDRRVIYISLTEQGQTEFNKNMERYSSVMNEIIEKVGREEVNQLIDTCERLRNVVDEVREQLVSSQGMIEEIIV